MFKALRFINAVAQIVGIAVLVGILCLVCADILSRSVFDRPVTGTIELVELGIVVLIFLNAPAALQYSNFIRSDGLLRTLERRRPKAYKAMMAAFNLLGALVFAAIAYGIWFRLVEAITRKSFIGTVGLFTAPTWPGLAAIFLGSVLLSLTYLMAIVQSGEDK